MHMTNERGFLWVDLETTGLNADTDQILEIACIFTDFHLNHLGDFHAYIKGTLPEFIDPFVIEMHRVTGLWDNLKKANEDKYDYPVKILDTLLTAWIKNLKEIYGRHHIEIAGRGIGQFDFAFIKRDFPLLTQELHYRVFDVVTLKTISEMCGQLIPDVKRYQPEHVARNDVKNALEYAREFFNPFVEVSTHAEHLKKLM